MKKLIYKFIGVMLVVVMAFALTGCFGPKTVTLSVPIVWEDDGWIDGEEHTWYAGIVEGLYNINTGMPAEPFEYKSIIPGTNTTVEFTFKVSTYGNYTVFVFMDEDQNGEYNSSEDFMGDYCLATVGPDDVPTNLDLTPYY